MSNSSKIVLHNLATNITKVLANRNLGGVYVSAFQPLLEQGTLYFQYEIDNTLLLMSISASQEVDQVGSSAKTWGRFLPSGKKGACFFVYSNDNKTFLQTHEGDKVVNEKELPFVEQLEPLGYHSGKGVLTAIGKLKGMFPTLCLISDNGVEVLGTVKDGVISDVLFDNTGTPQLAKFKGTTTRFIACNPERLDLATRLTEYYSQTSLELKWSSRDLSRFIFGSSSNLEEMGYSMRDFNTGNVDQIFENLFHIESSSVRIESLNVAVNKKTVLANKITMVSEDNSKRPIAILMEGGAESARLNSYSPTAFTLLDAGFDVVRVSVYQGLFNFYNLESPKTSDIINEAGMSLNQLVEELAKVTGTKPNQMVIYASGYAAMGVEQYLNSATIKVAACALFNPANTEMLSNYLENYSSASRGTLNESLIRDAGKDQLQTASVVPTMKTIVGSFVMPNTSVAEMVNNCIAVVQANEFVEVLNYNESFEKGVSLIKKELVEQMAKRLRAEVK
jgi:hypothetical protein